MCLNFSVFPQSLCAAAVRGDRSGAFRIGRPRLPRRNPSTGYSEHTAKRRALSRLESSVRAANQPAASEPCRADQMAEIAFEDSSEPPEAVGFSCILAALRSKHRPRRAHKCAQIPESAAAELPRISTRQEQPNNPRASWRESPGRLNYAQEHAHPYRRIRSHPNAVCFDTRAVNSMLHPENLRTSRVGITRHSAESQPSAIRARNPRITRMSLGSRQCPLRRFRGYTADRQGQRHART